MGLIEFILLCILVVAIAWIGCYALDNLLPGHPPIVNTIIWVVAIIIILTSLLRATGLIQHDPQIPHL